MSHIAKTIAAFKIENVPLKYQVAYVCIPFISLYLLILFPEYYSPKLERLVHGGGGGGGVNINIFVFCPTNRFLNIIRLSAHIYFTYCCKVWDVFGKTQSKGSPKNNLEIIE